MNEINLNKKKFFLKKKNHYIYKHLMKTRLYTHNLYLPNPDANNSGSIKSPAPENIINIL